MKYYLNHIYSILLFSIVAGGMFTLLGIIGAFMSFFSLLLGIGLILSSYWLG